MADSAPVPLMTSRLAEWRAERRLTHRALGELVGVDHSTIGRWERNEVPMTLRNVEQLALVLDCHPLALICDLAPGAALPQPCPCRETHVRSKRLAFLKVDTSADQVAAEAIASGIKDVARGLWV